jgi:hypothetical protein
MFEEIVNQFQKTVRNKLGSKLTFSGVQKIIDESADKQTALLSFAYLFSLKKIREKATWRKLGEMFFSFYHPTLTEHYTTEIIEIPQNGESRIDIPDSDLLIDQFARMKLEGIIGNCSYQQLAKIISANFALPYTLTTISNKLKMYELE